MKPFKLLLLLFIPMFLTVSCKKESTEIDICENVSCLNGGTCVDGTCDCPPGTSGDNCEILDPCFNIECFNGADCELGICICPSGYSGDQCENYTSVAERLLNESPLEIVESGILVDSLYGKFYAGGYIFYIDTEDIIAGKEGLVCAANDIQGTYIWGCDDQDSESINVTANPLYPETTIGARPGDGITNTLEIINSSCATGSAAGACNSFIDNNYDDWFLPSRGGLLLVYYNLEARGHDLDFLNSFYWSSSENNLSTSWNVHFAAGSPSPLTKTSIVRVRAVRAF